MRDEPILVKVRFKGCEETRPLALDLVKGVSSRLSALADRAEEAEAGQE